MSQNKSQSAPRPRPLGVDPSARVSRKSRSRFAIVPLGTLFIGAVLVALSFIPLRTWNKQRTLVAQRTAQLAAYEDINASLQEEVDNLKTPQGAKEAVRSQLGYLSPSEKRVPLLDSPSASITLPDRWPYSLVSNILKIKTEEATRDKSVGILDTLQP
ncbi:MAG: hypothetical protein EBT42_06955 [Actinobacteria bacterium]|nr:hypothetical protein [Actinomycetota bacterium]